MRYLIMIIVLMAGVGFAQRDCSQLKDKYKCNVLQVDVKDEAEYCGVFIKGFGGRDIERGDFVELMPIEYCTNDKLRTPEMDYFYAYSIVTGSDYKEVADSTGKGFKIELTAAQDIEIKKRKLVKIEKVAKLTKKVK